jgi:hypothetical protein
MQAAIGWLVVGSMVLVANGAQAFPSYGTQVDQACTSRQWVPARPFDPNATSSSNPSLVNCGLCHTQALSPNAQLTAAGQQFKSSGYSDFTPFCAAPVTNRPPQFTAIPPQRASVGQLFGLTVTATDPDGGPVLLNVSSPPAGSTFVDNANGTSSFGWTPTPSQIGNHTVTFHAVDTGTPMAGANLDVTISVGDLANRPPLLAPIGDRQVGVGMPLMISLSATDPDGNRLVYTVAPLPLGAVLTGNVLRWTPAADLVGNYPVTFSVTDDGTPPASDSEAIVITVGSLNRPPLIAAIGDRVVQIGERAQIPILASDPDSVALAIDCRPLPAGASFTDLGDGTGEIVWTPIVSGSYAVTCTVADDSTPPGMAAEMFLLTAREALPPAGAGGAVIDDAYWRFDDRSGELRVAGHLALSPMRASEPRRDERDERDDEDRRSPSEERERGSQLVARIGIYAILRDGTALALGTAERGEVDGSFRLALRPFIAPCQVAAGIDGVLGEVINVRNAPATCDEQLLLEIRSARLCASGELTLEGRRAPVGGALIASDATTGQAIVSLPVTKQNGSFRYRGRVSGAPRSLAIRVRMAGMEWTLDSALPIARDARCRAGSDDAARAEGNRH